MFNAVSVELKWSIVVMDTTRACTIVWGPVSWGCRTCWLHLCRGIRPPNECPGYDIKPSDGKVPALKIWIMWNTFSLLLLPGPLWPRVVSPDRVLSMGEIELFDYLNWVQTNDWCLIELLVIHSNTWNHLTLLTYAKLLEIELFAHLTVCEQMADV